MSGAVLLIAENRDNSKGVNDFLRDCKANNKKLLQPLENPSYLGDPRVELELLHVDIFLCCGI
jgi:hypothetical protein